MSPRTTGTLEWDAWQLRIATEAAGVGLWAWNVDTDALIMDERAHHLWGVPKSGSITFKELSSCIHPEDLDRVQKAFAAAREADGAYETDFRISQGNKIRWISARGRGDGQAIVGRTMFGIFIDVSVAKLAEEAQEMLSSEMNHRIKNLFTIAAGLTAIASRSTTTKEELVYDLTQRLTALSDAHDLACVDLNGTRKPALIGDLLSALLRPYAAQTLHADRVLVTAPELIVGDSSATALALIVHELATNSIKYGALSSKTGLLEVSCGEQNNDMILVWKETGGPPIVVPNKRTGFGRQLITRSVSEQLGGSLEVEWPMEGALIKVCINKARLAL